MQWYYIKKGYALVPTDSCETGHWFGGEATHCGARCPECKNALLLLADFDCREIRKTEEAKLFHSLDRLPFYYCWRCEGTELTYIVNDAKRIQVVKYEGKKALSNFSYENYPNSFPRRPVSLVPIDYPLAKLLAVYQEVGDDWLSEEDSQAIRSGLGQLRHPEFAVGDVNRHQLGGLVKLIQGHNRVGCSNPTCERHRCFYKDGNTSCCMKELAVLFNDPISGLPLVEPGESFQNSRFWNEFVQVVFWICEECLAITASNQCD